MRSCTGISTSVRSSLPRALYFCVLPCGASLTGLCAVRAYKDFVLRCTVRAPRAFCAVRAYKGFIQRAPGLVLLCTVRALARCEPTKALRFCVPYERQELCAVRAYKGFVPLCTVRAPRALRGASLQRLSLCAVGASRALCGASLQRLSTVYERQELCAVRASKGFLPCTSAKSFARCEPPKAFYRVRAPRALRGASLQRLCASVCCKSLTSFVRCEPTKTPYRVLVLAPQDL